MMEQYLIEMFKSRQDSNKHNEIILPLYVSIKCQSTCVFNNSLIRKQDGKSLLFEQHENQPDFLNANILNQFLKADIIFWDTLVIKGPFGFRMKKLARHFEEYLWKYQAGVEIPILVQIEEFEGLKSKNLDQILKERPYYFDFDKLQELKQQVNDKQLQLVLIISSCKSQEEQQEFKKFHFNLCEEWNNCKIIRFVDSNFEIFTEANSLTVEIDYFSDNEVKEIFSLACNKNLYQCLIKLYLDLNLDQKNLENFLKQTKDVILQLQGKGQSEIQSIIDQIFEQIKSDDKLKKNRRAYIVQLLNYNTIIWFLHQYGLGDLLRIPYSLFIILEIYPKFSREQLTKFHFLKCFLKKFLFYEYLDKNQLSEKNLNPHIENEIFTLNCQKILENLSPSHQEISLNQDQQLSQFQNTQIERRGLLSVSIFLQQNRKIYNLAQQITVRDYIFQIINAVNIELTSNRILNTNEITKKILNYLMYDETTQILRQVSLNFDTLIFDQFFQDIEDSFQNRFSRKKDQIIIFIYFLMSGIKSQSQTIHNLKRLLLTILAGNYKDLHQSIDDYNIIISLPSGQIQNNGVVNYFSILSENVLRNSNQKRQCMSICFQLPYLQRFFRKDFKRQQIFPEQTIKKQNFKQKQNLYIISTIISVQACTLFGPFFAYLSSNQTIVLFNIRNLKIMRKLKNPIHYSPEMISLALSNDSQYLAGSSFQNLFLYKLKASSLSIQEYFYDSKFEILEIKFLVEMKLLVLLNNFQFNIIDLKIQTAIIKPSQVFQGQIININLPLGNSSIKLISEDGMVYMLIDDALKSQYFICSEDFECQPRNLEVGQQFNISNIKQILETINSSTSLRPIIIYSKQGQQANPI